MSEDRIIYKSQDITVDVMLKIEHIVRIIAGQLDLAFDDAYAGFVNTRTYEALQKPGSLMWAESAEYIADRYHEERGEQQS
jgi:hypothetical protein